MESLQYLRLNSSFPVKDIRFALHSLMTDFLTNTKESRVLTETSKLRYLALGTDNYRIHYQPGFNCQAYQRIKLVKTSDPVPTYWEHPFEDFLRPNLNSVVKIFNTSDW